MLPTAHGTMTWDKAATFPGFSFLPVVWAESQVHRIQALNTFLIFSQSKKMAGAPPCHPHPHRYPGLALLTVPPAPVPGWPCLGRGFPRVRPGGTPAVLLGLSACRVQGKQCIPSRCCPVAAGTAALGEPAAWGTASLPILLMTSQGPLHSSPESRKTVLITAYWLPSGFCSLSAHS